MRGVVGLVLVFGALLLFWFVVSPDSFKAAIQRVRSQMPNGPANPLPAHNATGRNQQ